VQCRGSPGLPWDVRQCCTSLIVCNLLSLSLVCNLTKESKRECDGLAGWLVHWVCAASRAGGERVVPPGARSGTVRSMSGQELCCASSARRPLLSVG